MARLLEGIERTSKSKFDERTEAFRFSAESPGYRPRNYLQWIPPRSISVQYRYNF
jgi:hypothetical protein